MVNCSIHSMTTVAEPFIWEAVELRFRGFKMSNAGAVFLLPKITGWVQALDQGDNLCIQSRLSQTPYLINHCHARQRQVYRRELGKAEVRSALEWRRSVGVTTYPDRKC